jgi:hypothetical protein
MAIKFNEMTFDLKDLLLIIGLVAGYFRFEQKQKDMYNELRAEIASIVADNKLQEVKVNARFDAMLNKPTSEKQASNKMLQFIAVLHDNRIGVVKKRLVKFRLV